MRPRRLGPRISEPAGVSIGAMAAARSRRAVPGAGPRGWGCARRGLAPRGLRPDGPPGPGRPPAPLPRPRAALPLRVLPLVRRPARLRALGLPRTPAARSTSRRATCRSSVPTTCAPCRRSSSTRAGSRTPASAASRSPGGDAAAAGPRRPAHHGRDARRTTSRSRSRSSPTPTTAARRFADDILYLLREYGEKRRCDAFLLLRNEDGRRGPGLQGLPLHPAGERDDCHGGSSRRLGLHARRVLAASRPTACARRCAATSTTSPCSPTRSSSRARRPPASTASGSTTTSSRPRTTARYAEGASRAGLLFSFNVNPGYDQIEPRDVRRGPDCYAPRAVRPVRRRGSTGRSPTSASARRAPPTSRIAASLEATVARPDATPARPTTARGFFLVYVNSLQRVARGPRLRAHEGRGRAHARRARARLPQPVERRLPPAGARRAAAAGAGAETDAALLKSATAAAGARLRRASRHRLARGAAAHPQGGHGLWRALVARAPRRERRLRRLGARLPAQGEAGEGVRPLALHRDGARAGRQAGADARAALLLPPGRSRARARADAPGASGERRLLPDHECGALRLPALPLAAPARPRLLARAAGDRPPGHRLHAGCLALVRVPVLDERSRSLSRW